MRRVLVVDDEEAITEALCDLFETEGIKADAAAHGKEALERMVDTRYDVVFLDYMMPVLNGQETLARIRSTEHLARQKVILMSAFPEASLQLDGLHIDGMLRKPFDLDAVLDLVERLQADASPD